MAKQILRGKEARDALYRGAKELGDTVVITLGPKGRNVALDKKFNAPLVVHDGVSVAKEIDLPDPFENMGAQLVKEAASKTNDKSGDGTTTATLLALGIIEAGMKYVVLGFNPMDLKKGIEQAVALVVAEIQKIAKPIKTQVELEQVAIIAAQREDVGKLIAEAMFKMGKDGVVTVEEGSGLKTEVEYKDGMQFDKGYGASHFITDHDRAEGESIDPFILISEKKITSNNDLFSFLKMLSEKGLDNLVIIGEVEGEALATLIWNKLRGRMNSLVISPPAFGDRRKAILEDIAVLTGGTVLYADLIKKLENVTVEELGRAEKIWCDAETTKIIGGKGDKAKIGERVKQIQTQIDKSESDFEKDKLKERIAKLTVGVAVIKVGAPTEIEMKDLKERINDAVGATRSAFEEGIIVGGGVSLLRAKQTLLEKGQIGSVINNGFDIIFNILDLPLRTLLRNAGNKKEEKIIDTILESKDLEYGYNLETEKFGNLYEMGVVDPAKVVRLALQNAASVGAMVLTTEALVTDVPENDPREKMSPTL